MAKYAVGDIVEFCGSNALVTEVKENFFFGQPQMPYYMYDIELQTSGQKYEVSEASLILVTSKFQTNITCEFEEPKTDAPIMKNNQCECGAWSIHWMHGQHAPYCPLGMSYV